MRGVGPKLSDPAKNHARVPWPLLKVNDCRVYAQYRYVRENWPRAIAACNKPILACFSQSSSEKQFFPFRALCMFPENKHFPATLAREAGRSGKNPGRFQNPALMKTQEPFLLYRGLVYFSCNRKTGWCALNTGANV